MSLLQQFEMKVLNEVKMKVENITTSDVTYKKIKEAIKFIFGGNVYFDLNKDWNITFAFRDGGDKTGTVFTGTLKMTEKDVSKDQLSLFSDNTFQEEMQKVVDNDEGIEKISLINTDTGEEKTIAKKRGRKVQG